MSVVIPVYNAAPTLARAINSVLMQDYRPMEVLIVDDGSTDNSREVVNEFAEEALRLIALDRNSGECAAMNAGIKNAKGKYIAFLDADDEWLAGKLTKQVELIETKPNFSFVACNGKDLHSDGRVVESDHALMVEGPEAWRALLRRSIFDKPCVLASREKLIELNGFDPNLPVAGDQDMWIRLALVGEVGCVREYGALIHKTAGSLMRRYPLGEIQFLLPLIKRHIKAQKNRLSASEIQTILSSRLRRISWNMYERGFKIRGLCLYASSIYYAALARLFRTFSTDHNLSHRRS